MKRAAIYARYSSDKQNDRSAADQIALCEAFAKRENIEIVGRYADEAVSGASVVNRPGLSRLLSAAASGVFDIVLCEALDRLSRHQADIHAIRRDLAFREVSIMTVQDGQVTAIHAGVKGMLSELYLADLAQKTKRGQSARVREGSSGGGKSYGYDAGGRAGDLAINEAEARIVRRIFAEYVGGATPRQIVAGLNRDHIPSPRGGQWAANTLNGNPKRQNGILNNRLYAGEIVWNRQRFIKDPLTGKRVSRPNDESEWLRAKVPQLAIVDPETFVKAAELKTARALPHPSRTRRPRFMFSGLVKCAHCGGSMIIVFNERLGCLNAREKGTCDCRLTIRRQDLEDRVLDALKGRLGEPAYVERYVATYVATLAALRKKERAAMSEIRQRLNAIKAELNGLLDMLLAGAMDKATIKSRSAKLEVERDELETRLAAAEAEAPDVEFLPSVATAYRKQLTDLKEGPLRGEPGTPAFDRQVEKLRRTIEKIVVRPQADKEKPAEIEVHGMLAELLSISAGSSPNIGPPKVVAGVRNHHYPTFVIAA